MIQIDDCDSATPTEESKAESIESLRSHLPFLNIVSRGKELFGAEIVLTVLQAEEQLYLSTGGDVLSEATTFISHSILTQARGLIVLDALNDSRFATDNL